MPCALGPRHTDIINENSSSFSEEDSLFFYFYCVLFHVCGLCVRISVERIVKCLFVLWLQVRIQRGGGQGVRTPLENHKLNGFQQGISNWTPPTPWKMLDPLWNLKNDTFLWNLPVDFCKISWTKKNVVLLFLSD